MTKITTILTTFQRPKLLRRALDSALTQTMGDLIVAIHDNGSQDETPLIVEEYQKKDRRIRYFRRETNIGLVENLAQALEHVQTPYFSFLSDDDFLLPRFYEMALEGFHRYPEVGFSAGRTLKANLKGRLNPQQFLVPYLEGFFLPKAGVAALATASLFPIWTGILFKTKILEQIGGVEKRAEYGLDMEMTLRYAAAAPFAIDKRAVAIFTQWKQSASSIPSDIRNIDFQIVTENVRKHFIGSLKEWEALYPLLKQKELGGMKHIWIHSLLARRIDNAQRAREKFLADGGKINRLKLNLLTWAERNPLICTLYHLYFHTKNYLGLSIAYFRMRMNDKRA